MIVELLSVACGIISMLGYGFSDFLSKRVVGGIGYFRLVMYTQLVALAPVLLLGAIYTPHVPLSATSITPIIASGLCSFSALFFFYKGLETGKASIIVTVFSTYAIVAIVLSFAAFGQTLSLPQIVSIAVTLIGVLTITFRSDSAERSNTGIPYALASMLSAGLGAVLIRAVSNDVGEIASLFFNRVIAVLAVIIFGVLFLRSHLRSGTRDGFPVKSIVLIGLAEFAAFFSFVVGVSVGVVSLVATLSSASPAVTVVLAQTFLKERLSKSHKYAVVLVIVGILLLSIAST
jgi:drug/metabolite transporter (DMT)-like permease